MPTLPTIAELTSQLIAEKITTSVHLFPEYGSNNWALNMKRSNNAGDAAISLRGPNLEELLLRGLETITGVALRGPKALTHQPEPKA